MFKNIWGRLLGFQKKQKLLPGTDEIQGLVIKQGINPKTVTVRAWWKTWNFRYRLYFKNGKNYQVHDEKDHCRVGDIVVIKKSFQRISNTKSFYVRNIEKYAPRFDSWNDLEKSEQKVLNEKLYKTDNSIQDASEEFKLKALKERFEQLRSANIMNEFLSQKE